MEPVSREQKGNENRISRTNRIMGRGLAIFIVLYIAATICFIILV
jgi:hypothetical protein